MKGADLTARRSWKGAARALALGALGLASGLGALAAGAPREAAASDSAAAPRLELRIDPADVDLERGRLTATLSRPAARLTLEVFGQDGKVLAKAEQTFDAAPPGSPLSIRWTPPAEAVARLELFGHDTGGHYKGVAITPWSFEIPHEDVVFRTNSADIDPAEEKKLAASLASIEKELPKAKHLGPVTLFILAHTDTVGSAEHNLRLSTRRALSIARWFRAHGLKLPMAYDGMGESMLKRETADEVDEPKNRRADYMLSIEPPRFKQSGLSPAWKRL